MESNILYWIIGGTAGAALAAFEVLLIRTLIRVPPPHKLLVVSGRQYRQGKKTRGFAVFGRPRFVMPVVERVDELDTTCVPCTVEVHDVRLEDGGPVTARWFSLVRISRDPELIPEAVERFLGCPADEVRQVVRETIEQEARTLIAKRECRRVDEGMFTGLLGVNVELSLKKLGLELTHLSLEHCGKEV